MVNPIGHWLRIQFGTRFRIPLRGLSGFRRIGFRILLRGLFGFQVPPKLVVTASINPINAMNQGIVLYSSLNEMILNFTFLGANSLPDHIGEVFVSGTDFNIITGKISLIRDIYLLYCIVFNNT